MELTGARILVTGATGLLGGRVVDHLVTRSDVTVRLLVRNVSKLDRFEGQVLETVIGDITDPLWFTPASAIMNFRFTGFPSVKQRPPQPFAQKPHRAILQGSVGLPRSGERENRHIHQNTIS